MLRAEKTKNVDNGDTHGIRQRERKSGREGGREGREDRARLPKRSRVILFKQKRSRKADDKWRDRKRFLVNQGCVKRRQSDAKENKREGEFHQDLDYHINIRAFRPRQSNISMSV